MSNGFGEERPNPALFTLPLRTEMPQPDDESLETIKRSVAINERMIAKLYNLESVLGFSTEDSAEDLRDTTVPSGADDPCGSSTKVPDSNVPDDLKMETLEKTDELDVEDKLESLGSGPPTLLADSQENGESTEQGENLFQRKALRKTTD